QEAHHLPYLPGDRDHGLSGCRWHARTCAAHGGARKPAHDQALRPYRRCDHARRGRAHQDLTDEAWCCRAQRTDTRRGGRAARHGAALSTTREEHAMDIRLDDVRGPEIAALLQEHLRDMHRVSPPASVHALDLESLRQPDITVWTLWEAGTL